MRRRGANSLAGSPLLIGAVTTLVIILAVFLAYNANNGLPFVPTYRVKVRVPDASELRVGDEVRVGGTRVGVVAAEEPQQDPRTGAVTAVLTLSLQARLRPLHAGTTVLVANRSALGSKYLQLTPGTSSPTLAPGQVLPLSAATPQPVDVDQLLGMFNPRTRAAIQTSLAAYGDALAGRGRDLNDAITSLASALADLQPVASSLAAPRTQLAALLVALERAAATVAPVAGDEPGLVDDLDTTLHSLATVTPSIGQAIDQTPSTLAVGTRTLIDARPFVARLTRLAALLDPATGLLRTIAPTLDDAVTAGATNLGPANAINPQLQATLRSLRTFALAPDVSTGVSVLTNTAGGSNPLVADLAGMQTACNYPTLLLRNLSSSLAEGSASGTWLRALPIFPYTIFDPAPANGATPDPSAAYAPPNSEFAPASAPASGGTVGSSPAREAAAQFDYLHTDPYPYVSAPGQPANVCEAGNETFVPGKTVIGHAPSVGAGRDTLTGDG